MDVEKAIMTRRTIRKYKQQPISRDILVRLIEGARLAPSASNLQPLVYLVIDDPDQLESVFGLLGWAGYLAPSGTPREGEKPVAYIIVLANTHIRMSGFEHDAGAAIENILLMAWSMGIGSCWIGFASPLGYVPEVFKELNVPEDHRLIASLVFGYPKKKDMAPTQRSEPKITAWLR